MNQIKFNNEYFGMLQPYVEDDNVTDINFDGVFIWIDDLVKGKYRLEKKLSGTFINQFCMRIANIVSRNFNKSEPVLEAETDKLRISILHESVAYNGTAISIRKTPTTCRLSEELMLQTQYCSEEVLAFLIACVKGHLNIVFCGLPGCGKTELLKYLTQYIPREEKTMTIEDNLEIHYSQINPFHHCVELKVDDDVFKHTDAIKSSLRQNAEWILLSEARSVEVKYLLECFSTGLHGLTTLHTDDVRKIPDRILNMIQDSYAATRLENDVYSFVNIGVLIRKTTVEGQTRRSIDQISIFDRNNGVNTCTLVMDEGKILAYEVPQNIEKKLKMHKIQLGGKIDEHNTLLVS